MNRASQRKLLIVLIGVLALVLVLLIGLTVHLTLQQEEPASTTELPTVTPTEAPQISTTAPVETTVPATEPTVVQTEPQTQYYTLSFAGDCTFANRKGKTGKSTFIGTVGENYAYPFADVLQYFANDDCTFVNLENPLTEGGTPDTKKEFVFRGPTSYVNILTEGSVEYAGVVNNHTMDYGKDAYNDTLALLDGAGIAAEMARQLTLHERKTQVLAASFRTAAQVERCFAGGVTAVTITAEMFETLAAHPGTMAELASFDAKWNARCGGAMAAHL